MAEVKYNEDNIKSLDWKEHIRLRPGMYIGKLGDGSHIDDGIYILVKEVESTYSADSEVGLSCSNRKSLEILMSSILP